MQKSPLCIHFLAHQDSDLGKEIAELLLRQYLDPLYSGGLRLPVFLTPTKGDFLPPRLEQSELDLDFAQHTIVVLLIDTRMNRKVEGEKQQWQDFLEELIRRAPPGKSSHHILPVVIDAGGRSFDNSHHVLSAIIKEGDKDSKAKQIANISLHLSAIAIQLLKKGQLEFQHPEQIKAPVTLFISHAKADLKADSSDPANRVMQQLTTLPINSWYDAQNITTSQKFESVLVSGVDNSSVLIAFQTDAYSGRPWCRREVLDAKRLGIPIIVVNALADGEDWSFSYLGNAPNIHWHFSESADVEAFRVVCRSVKEALRQVHNEKCLAIDAKGSQKVLPIAPEAATLAYVYPNYQRKQTLIYPDPPLDKKQLEVLQNLRPKGNFVTPLTKIARLEAFTGINTIAISTSKSNDLGRLGFTSMQFDTLTDEIYLYFLMAGFSIAYGGHLQTDTKDTSNFTLRLFDLVRSYSELGQSLGKALKPIQNFAPWPLHEDYRDKQLDLFGDEAELIRCEKPNLSSSTDALFPPKGKDKFRFTCNSAEQRYAWSTGLALMRNQITESTQARVVVGGNLDKYSGILPGIVEESWLSVKAGKPLFIIGGFGGAAKALCDTLRGVARNDLDEDAVEQKIAFYKDTKDLFHKDEITTLADIKELFIAQSKQGIGKFLNNGLNEKDNLELMQTIQPTRIASLIFKGLRNLAQSSSV